MKLRQYAQERGILYRTAWEHFRLGKIPGAYKDNTGHIIVPDRSPELDRKVAVYARVSSAAHRDSLDRQAERVQQWCQTNGYEVVRVVKEVGSGVSDTRPKLTRLFEHDDYGLLVVEHKDRLTRFGWNWLDMLARARGKELVVINAAATDEADLMQDMLAIVYSFTAKLYGARRAKAARDAIVEATEGD